MKPKNKIILSVSLVCALLLVSIPASAALGGLHAKPAAEPQAASAPAVSSLPPAASSAAPSSAPVSQPAMAVSSVPPAAQAAASETGSAAGTGKATAHGTQTAKADIKDELTMTIQGKTYTFKRAADSEQYFKVPGMITYKTANGMDELELSASTGKLEELSLISLVGPSSLKLTREQALAVCNNFINTQKEFAYLRDIFKGYTLDKCELIENEYEIDFSKHLYGYRTTEQIQFTVLPGGLIEFFSFRDDGFHNVKLPVTFDEKPYLDKLAASVDLSSCDINERWLFVTGYNHLGMGYITVQKNHDHSGYPKEHFITLDGWKPPYESEYL